MGCLTEEDILTGISFLEVVLKELGYQFKPGVGVTAAKKIFSDLSQTKKQ